MADSTDDAQSTFSHAITLQEDNDKAEESTSTSSSQKLEKDSSEVEALQEEPSSSDKTTKNKKKDNAPPPTPKTSDLGSFQVIYGPGMKCTVVSSFTGWKMSSPQNSLLPAEFADDSNNVVTNYAITPHGDELVLYYGAKDKVPGWMWRSAGKPNSPSYQSLKSWLTGLLTSRPQDLRNARIVFGSGASYYAQCGELCLFHDLPSRLHEGIEQYRQALDKARAVKAEREANPEVERQLVDADFQSITGPLPLNASRFNLDNLRASSLPDCVALGIQGTYVATWPGLCLVATTRTNVLWQELIEKTANIARVRYFSLSLFSAQHAFVVMNDWSYRMQFAKGMLDLVGCLKEHVQAWIKLKPGRWLVWEILPVGGGDVAGVMRLDNTTDFKLELNKSNGDSEDNEKKDKGKETEKEKQTKPRRLLRLFGRREKETATNS